MSALLALPPTGSVVMVGTAAATVVGGWRREGRTVLEVLMPSGRTYLWEQAEEWAG